MTTLPSHRVRSCNISDKWLSNAMDNHRKIIVTNNGPPLGNNWSRNSYPKQLRCPASNNYRHEGSTSDHDIKYPDRRTSEETVIDDDNLDKNNLPNYPEESAYIKPILKHNTEPQCRGKYPRVNEPELNMSEALIAMQKLQRLRELQRRRDLCERYYSQEIRRLIGEHYFGSRVADPSLRPNERMYNYNTPSYHQNQPKNNLEPCGTMTTITRLDCGCVQETTRPIFTTARGRVQKKTCTPSQDEVLLKLTSSNPQEHLFSSVDAQKDRGCVKSKKRLSLDPRMYTTVPSGLNRDIEIENDQKTDAQQSEVPDRVSRNSSPFRKISDTTVTSI